MTAKVTPHEIAIGRERRLLGQKQAKLVMPMIGQLIDTWDDVPLDARTDEFEHLGVIIELIANAMEFPDG